MEELNFFIVAPHWYFRPHMGLLTVCAQHYEGLFWFACFYILLCFLPAINRFFNQDKHGFAGGDFIAMRQSKVQQAAYVIFVGAILYTGGTLPCGRFYYEAVEGFFGNVFLKLSYQYIFFYMGLFVHVLDLMEKKFIAIPLFRSRPSQL